MNRRLYVWISLVVAILAAWVGYRVYLAKKNLVTLNVRDADVRDVIRKCEWQTWETIVANKDVKGKVSLNVRKVPLEEVLGIIGEQTSSRVTAVYPIFSKGNSIVNLRKLARGDIDHASAGWTNFVMRGDFGRRGGGPGFGGRGGGGPFGGPGGPGGGLMDGLRSQDSVISLSVPGKDLGFAALALSRASQAQVVPEDGATATIMLQLAEVSIKDAVAKVAKQAHRKWEVFYSMQAQPDFFADRGDDEDRGPRRGGRGDGEDRGFRRNRGDGETNRFDTNRWAELREREMEVRLATMSPEEQAKAKEQQQQFEQMRNATPEERQQFFEQMRNNPQNQQRFENRRISYLNNSSPEQRADRTKQMMERRARRQQQPRR